MQGETDSAEPDCLTDAGGEVGAPPDDRAVFLTDVGRGLTQVHVGHGIEVSFHKGKLVTTETWRKWSGARTAELWQAIALLCFIDSEGWTLEQMRRVSTCRFRLELALEGGSTRSLTQSSLTLSRRRGHSSASTTFAAGLPSTCCRFR